jgi:hypothetical protein
MLQIVESLRHITKHCLKTTGDRRSIKKPISLTFEGMDMVSGGDNKTSDGILSSAQGSRISEGITSKEGGLSETFLQSI